MNAITVSKRKDTRGRIMCYSATLGHVEHQAPSAQEAKAGLEARIARICGEWTTPVMVMDHSGDPWICYMTAWGSWCYGRFTGLPGSGEMRSCGTSMRDDDHSSKAEMVAAMKAHVASLAPLATEGKL